MSPVSVLSVSKIFPNTPTPQPCWTALSNLDYVCSSHTYVKQVYYYKAIFKTPYSDFDLLVSKLKDSLSKTLSHFYPLAGRVEHNEESGTLQINCNDAGIPFREALAECRLADWSDLQECSIEHMLYPPEHCISNYSIAPLIQVQVTKFLCGSIALGYAMSDLVADGYSSIEFMKSWSEMQKNGKISKVPLFNAELLKPRNPLMVTVPITSYIALHSHSHSASMSMSKESSASLNKSKLFTFTTDKVEALVHEVHDGPHSFGFRASSFEAMAGLIWKCLTETRELADDNTTFYKYSVSLRNNINRWEPCIPINYFGKAVYVACLPARVGDIKAKHVSYAARLMHDDVQELISVEAIKSTVDWMQVQLQKRLEIGFSCDFSSGRVVNGTSLHTFPIYETDFGWGRPMHFSLLVPPWYGDGVAFVLPTPQGGRSRYLLVVLPEDQLAKLSTHPLFLAFATPTKISTTS